MSGTQSHVANCILACWKWGKISPWFVLLQLTDRPTQSLSGRCHVLSSASLSAFNLHFFFLTHSWQHLLTSARPRPLYAVAWLYRCKHLKRWKGLLEQIFPGTWHPRRSVFSRKHSVIWLLSLPPPSTEKQKSCSCDSVLFAVCWTNVPEQPLCTKGVNPSE